MQKLEIDLNLTCNFLFIESKLLNFLVWKFLSAVCKTDVIEEFGKKIKFVLDGGKSKEGLESTIVNLVGNQKILRLGSLDRSKIEKFLIKTKTNKKKV